MQDAVTYVRPLLPRGPAVADSYNALSSSSSDSSSLEYWTNGTTTILMSAQPSPLAHNQVSSSYLSSFTTRSNSTSSNMPKRTLTPPATAATPDQNMVRNSILAGSVAGMASTLVMYPMDVIRTKMQTAGMQAVSSNTATTTTSQQQLHMGSGPRQVLQHTLRHGGVRALYTGMAPVLAAQGVYKATVFAVNNQLQTLLLDFHRLEYQKLGGGRHLQYEPISLSLLDRYLCGAAGGALNAFLFVTPVEFVRNQLIAAHSRQAATSAVSMLSDNSKLWNTKSSTGSSMSAWKVIATSVSQHGWTSLWRGASWSVARDAWGCGWFFVTMAGTQQLLTPHNEKPTVPVTILAGGLSGLAYWVASLPLDTVKTWIQSADLNEASVSVSSTLTKTLQKEGPAGVVQQLFRGWQVAFGRGIPSAAITISVYSYAYRYLDHGAMAV